MVELRYSCLYHRLSGLSSVQVGRHSQPGAEVMGRISAWQRSLVVISGRMRWDWDEKKCCSPRSEIPWQQYSSTVSLDIVLGELEPHSPEKRVTLSPKPFSDWRGAGL